MVPDEQQQQQLKTLADDLQEWGKSLGFQQLAITEADTSSERQRLQDWLARGYQGSMNWIEERADMRLQPDLLVPGATRVIIARLNYLPPDTQQIQVLKSADKAYVSRYALGRDYHKLIRKRLATLAEKIRNRAEEIFPAHTISQRPFVDSAPVLERPLAERAGLGWVGKHTLLINEVAGSWFFLGEILTNVPLPVADQTAVNRCGDCNACLKVCPTDAFPQPYVLDARRCISYLTIENRESIPEEFRAVMGNRVFGCDDCQAICPWNKFAQYTGEADFHPRHGLADGDLATLFLWDEQTFLRNTEGSAIRRIGHEGWLRNLAVGLGNAPTSKPVTSALNARRNSCSPLVAEHIDWALAQHSGERKTRKRKLKRTDNR